MNDKMAQALNTHLNFEFNSSYLYFAMSAYFESLNLKGMAHWMDVQQQEETLHARKFYQYIFDRNGRVKLLQIDKPKLEWNSPSDAFDYALKHEEEVTAKINDLAGLAIEQKDFTTHNFLQWFLNEQIEEEATFKSIYEQVKMVEKSSEGLYHLDKDMGLRSLNAGNQATKSFSKNPILLWERSKE